MRRESGEISKEQATAVQAEHRNDNQPDGGEVNNESECDNDHVLTPYY